MQGARTHRCHPPLRPWPAVEDHAIERLLAKTEDDLAHREVPLERPRCLVTDEGPSGFVVLALGPSPGPERPRVVIGVVKELHQPEVCLPPDGELRQRT